MQFILLFFTVIFASLVTRALFGLLSPKHHVYIITSHNNAIIGYLQSLLEAIIPKTVLPNGAVMRLEVSFFWLTVSILTPDEEHQKFLKKVHVTTLFSIPIPFLCRDCVVYIVRHGESEANTGVKFINPSLTEKGFKDARRAGEAIQADLKKLRKKSSITCISSPLKRAIQTMAVIKNVMGITKRTILDVRWIETVRDMGRPIHTRGSNAIPATIIACNPELLFDSYRHDHICDPKIGLIALWKLVIPNRIHYDWRLRLDVDGSLLEKQLTEDWAREAAMTGLDTLLADYFAMAA